MKKMEKVIFVCCIYVTSLSSVYSQKEAFIENFDHPATKFVTVGRGACRISNGVFSSKDAYGVFGDKTLKNYIASFKARVPETADQVQIWFGFHAYNRNDRYVVGLKGGLQDDLQLMRLGYMGADEMLNLKTLDFHPVPGKWYDFKIEVAGQRIRIFLNNEKLPRIDMMDKNAGQAPSGGVTLGGAWIENQFDDLTIVPLEEDALAKIPAKEYDNPVSLRQKEEKRKVERAAYKPLVISAINDTRHTVSLNGNWLFMPDNNLKDEQMAIHPENEDSRWHIMSVPNFWTPIRAWLHGERMITPTKQTISKGTSDTYYQQETARCENYTFDYARTRAAWYRQWIELPENVQGKKMVIKFDGVAKVANVFINGTKAATHVGMFGDFQVDGSALLKPGKNLLAIHVVRDFVKNIKNADKIVDVAVTVPVTNAMLKDLAHGFYGGAPAGIWQPVSLEITDPLKIEDVFIRPSTTGATFDVTVRNDRKKDITFDLNCFIRNVDNKTLLYDGKNIRKISLKAGEEQVVTFSSEGLQPELWAPNDPHLYDFTFTLQSGKQVIDRTTIRSGFRTFTVKNGMIELNGKPYWLRGGNHPVCDLTPYDSAMIDKFHLLMRQGNILFTRTATNPYNEIALNSADKIGISLSQQGTWPWLMIKESMPEKTMLDMWAEEYLQTVKRFRNHPSILFWTVNNEMKFYDNEPNLETAKKKMTIISDVIKKMRQIDPTRPVCFDSNYHRVSTERRFGKAFFDTVDDGDIDDIHSYTNWYNHSMFKEFNGAFQTNFKYPEHALISQEFSTGYPNNETGHATRFYAINHQNPQTLVGYQAYDFADPGAFLGVNAFITKEIAEALRRSNERASGISHFALVCWFREVYNRNIQPYPAYYAVKKALQPVLVSAELWGRHFFAGEKLPVRVCIVNDRENGQDLKPSVLQWEIVSGKGVRLAFGKQDVPAIKYYGRQWIEPLINLPQLKKGDRENMTFKLRLVENNQLISENDYILDVADKNWSICPASTKKIILVGSDNAKEWLSAVKIPYTPVAQITGAVKANPGLIIIADMETAIGKEESVALKAFIAKGGKVLALNSNAFVKSLYPEYITGWITTTEGDIVSMEIPESPVFDGINLLDLRYFNNNKPELPAVCDIAYQINRNDNVTELASHFQVHGYVNGDMQERSDYVKTIKGFPVLMISEQNGKALISSMRHDKTTTDPVAARLLSNMVSFLLEK